MAALINPQPRLLSSTTEPDSPPPLPSADQDAQRDELFSLVRRINDPEHPHTLEELGVVDKAHIWFRRQDRRRDKQAVMEKEQGEYKEQQQQDAEDECEGEGEGESESEDEAVIELTPTVPHCSLATTIGLCVRHKVESAIPHIKLHVRIRDGTHRTAAESQTVTEINTQTTGRRNDTTRAALIAPRSSHALSAIVYDMSRYASD